MTASPFDLSGRVAVVTGAGSPHGIGFASARLLGRLGAAVVLGATSGRVHDRAGELAADGIDASYVVGDLTDESAAQALVDVAVRYHGRLDVLVNNAGMISTSDEDFQSGAATDMSLETWQASLRRNLDTAFLVSRAALPAMRSAGWGRVVMVTSVTGPVMAMRGDVAYAAAKAGMVGLARSLAVDLAGDGHHRQRGGAGLDRHRLPDRGRAPPGPADPDGAQRRPDEVASRGRVAELAGSLLRHRAVPGRRRRQQRRRGARLSRRLRSLRADDRQHLRLREQLGREHPHVLDRDRVHRASTSSMREQLAVDELGLADPRHPRAGVLQAEHQSPAQLPLAADELLLGDAVGGDLLSSPGTTARTSSSLAGQAAARDAHHAGVGVVAGEREHRVRQAALLPDLLEQPRGRAATERGVEHAERVAPRSSVRVIPFIPSTRLTCSRGRVVAAEAGGAPGERRPVSTRRAGAS